MKCYIVKDLLPNHVDGLNSEETSAEIYKHLDGCVDCRADFEKMSALIPQDIQPEEINFLKRLKAKMLRRNVIAAIFACIVLLGGLVIFARTYEIPIPFDPRRMTVEFVPNAVVINEDGSARWWDMDFFYNLDYLTFCMDDEVPATYEYVRDTLHIAFQGFNRISAQAIGRDIIRDGEPVRLVFHRYTKTPWDSLFFDYDLTDWQDSGRMTGTMIYGDRFHSARSEPRLIEIYYLPIRNFGRLSNFSDEDFDALRENAWRVWSGVS